MEGNGWTGNSRKAAVEVGPRAGARGVNTNNYTEKATDGMLQGANFAGKAELGAAVGLTCGVIASGGLTTVEDVRRLRQLPVTNLVGAIVGKALYEGRVSLADLLAAASGSE